MLRLVLLYSTHRDEYGTASLVRFKCLKRHFVHTPSILENTSKILVAKIQNTWRNDVSSILIGRDSAELFFLKLDQSTRAKENVKFQIFSRDRDFGLRVGDIASDEIRQLDVFVRRDLDQNDEHIEINKNKPTKEQNKEFSKEKELVSFNPRLASGS